MAYPNLGALPANAPVPDSDAAWRTLFHAEAVWVDTTPGGVHPFSNSMLDVEPTSIAASGVVQRIVPTFPFKASAYAVAGKTTKLRLMVGGVANGEGHQQNTIDLRLVTATSAPDTLSFDLATSAVTGSGISTGSFATELGLGEEKVVEGPAFDVPADGIYAICINIVLGGFNGGVCYYTAALQIAHV